MNKEELIEKVNSIHNLRTDQKILYEVMEELGIKFKKTTCIKCREDYLLVVKEELGMIENAAEESSFDRTEYRYLHNRSFSWVAPDGKRIIIGKNTPVEYIEQFVENHPGYYKKLNKEN